jgi:hypothetical protein
VVCGKGGSLTALALRPELGDQVAEAAVTVAVLLGDVAQGAVFHEDRAQGLIAPLQDGRGLAEEVFAEGVVHSPTSGNVIGLLRPRLG